MSRFDRTVFSESFMEKSKDLGVRTKEKMIEQTISFVDRQFKDRTELGKGRAGEVWVGEEDILKDICIKVIHDPTASPNSLEREFNIQDKATQSGARIAEPIMYAEGSEGQEEYETYQILAMETLPGRNLEDQMIWMRRNDKKWTVEQYRDIVEDIKEQIELLHKANIYHRDLHLRNLFVGEDGKIRIIDFGHATEAVGIADEDEIYRNTVYKDGKQITEAYPRDNDAIRRFAKAVVAEGIIQKKNNS